jgi:predicted kinase
MSRLILMIGIPGCGKSTLTQKLLVKHPKILLISTDKIRCQLFGDEAIQGSWLQIWQEIKTLFQYAVTQKLTAIYDATNAQRRQRKDAIALAREIGFNQIIGIWVNTPLSVCLERNQKRDRQVREEIIMGMYQQLTDAPPSKADGLDRVIILRSKKEEG